MEVLVTTILNTCTIWYISMLSTLPCPLLFIFESTWQNQKHKRTYKIIPHIYIHGRVPKHQWGWPIHTTDGPVMHQVKGSEISSEHMGKKPRIFMLTK